VDAIVVTGGEPTIHKELPRFLKKLKGKGFLVKLDTNGFNSHILEECLQYVDYVALDVKTSLEKYERLGAKDTVELLRTIEILKTGKVEYEFRTTVVPTFVDDKDVVKIGELVEGARAFAFQQFIPDDTMDKSFAAIKPYSREKIAGFAESIRKFAENTMLRI
jgi:pyruvate formate lyase activating enzyme